MSSDAEKTVQRMDEALLDNCRRQGLFKSGDRVIAACSGGADSMALLLFLLRHRRTLEIEVLATHVNHGIRGETARRDADFVADFCRRNGVELFLYDAVQEGIEVPPRPSEDWARGLRYGWFDELAAREEAVIATAHTMSDQAETVLFRMARGTGLHGLTGIPPRRGCYVRPCLCLTRADTEAYCAALGQHYIQDETNDQDVYARNRIRHDAIPALQYANPAAERSIARLCRQMRALDDWLTGEAAALLQAATVPGGYDVTVLRRAEAPVLDAALHALIEREDRPTAIVVSDDILAVTLERLCTLRGISIPHDLSIVSFNNSLFARLTSPRLTSIDLNSFQLGFEAASQLVSHIEHPTLMATKSIIPHRIIERESCSRLGG